MLKHFILYFFLLAFASCFQNESNSSDALPGPDFSGIDTARLPFKFGNYLTFRIDSSTSISGILLDIDKDEGGVWYGICFADSNNAGNEIRLFGREVPGTDNCTNCFDIAYLKESAVADRITILKMLSLNRSKIEIGGIAAAENLRSLFELYQYGKDQREKPPTPCNGGFFFSQNRVMERYFNLNEILN